MRIALFTRLPGVLSGIAPVVRDLGHDFVGVVTTEGPRAATAITRSATLLEARPAGSDVLVADGPKRV